ncbi:MAG: hypothetical protein LBF78_15275, partial [Treponema sp.]|nr:hypothetical protein [Treponema sp.]
MKKLLIVLFIGSLGTAGFAQNLRAYGELASGAGVFFPDQGEHYISFTSGYTDHERALTRFWLWYTSPDDTTGVGIRIDTGMATWGYNWSLWWAYAYFWSFNRQLKIETGLIDNDI